jgi:hypothetical protein
MVFICPVEVACMEEGNGQKTGRLKTEEGERWNEFEVEVEARREK